MNKSSELGFFRLVTLTLSRQSANYKRLLLVGAIAGVILGVLNVFPASIQGAYEYDLEVGSLGADIRLATTGLDPSVAEHLDSDPRIRRLQTDISSLQTAERLVDNVTISYIDTVIPTPPKFFEAPSNPGEVTISQALRDALDVTVGDSLSLKSSGKKYVVVGTYPTGHRGSMDMVAFDADPDLGPFSARPGSPIEPLFNNYPTQES